jgi:hypothetical protein
VLGFATCVVVLALDEAEPASKQFVRICATLVPSPPTTAPQQVPDGETLTLAAEQGIRHLAHALLVHKFDDMAATSTMVCQLLAKPSLLEKTRVIVASVKPLSQ